MMRNLSRFIVALGLGGTAASPLWAASSGSFFSLYNSYFVVAVAFVIFVAVLLYLDVHKILARQLDKRAEAIRAELDEARALREEAQEILASYERKLREVKEKAKAIVEHARSEAELAAEVARKELEEMLARRLAAAEEHIASAQAAAEREVRNTAIKAATEAAGEVIAKSMKAADANRLIDESISEVKKRLH